MTAKYLTLITILALSASLLCSCGDDDTPTTPPPADVDSGYYATQEELMQAFQGAYEEMDFDTLSQLLHPDFRMLLTPETRLDFPALGSDLDRAEEIVIAENMFSGQDGSDALGHFVGPVTSIEFLLLEPRTAWVDSDPGGEFPDTQAALFDVRMYFHRAGFSTSSAVGLIKFFAAGKDTTIDGTQQTYWNMIGQQDFTGIKKSSENTPFGSVKALYR